MIIGVPKEIKGQEYRVALLPSAAYQLIKRGHKVVVEHNAGAGIGYNDADYESAGATIVREHAQVFQQSELIVKVKEPQASEISLLRPGQILFTYLHLAADKTLTEGLVKSGVTGIAYETIEVNRRLPLLEPMSEIAGRMSILVGGYFLAKHRERRWFAWRKYQSDSRRNFPRPSRRFISRRIAGVQTERFGNNAPTARRRNRHDFPRRRHDDFPGAIHVGGGDESNSRWKNAGRIA